MPDMSVRSIEDTSLKISDFEIENASKEIHFNVEAKSTIFNIKIRITSDSVLPIRNAGYTIGQRAISIG